MTRDPENPTPGEGERPQDELEGLELIAALRDGGIDLDAVDDEVLERALDRPDKLRTAMSMLGEGDADGAPAITIRRRPRSPRLIHSPLGRVAIAAVVLIGVVLLWPDGPDPAPDQDPDDFVAVAWPQADPIPRLDGSITTRTAATSGGAPDWQASPRAADADAVLRAAAVVVESADRYWSGFVHESGMVITLARAVAAEVWDAAITGRPARVKVRRFAAMAPLSCEVVSYDVRRGLAVLRPEFEEAGLSLGSGEGGPFRTVGSVQDDLPFAVEGQRSSLDVEDFSSARILEALELDPQSVGPLEQGEALLFDGFYDRGLAGAPIVDQNLGVVGVVFAGSARNQELVAIPSSTVRATLQDPSTGVSPLAPDPFWMGRPDATRRVASWSTGSAVVQFHQIAQDEPGGEALAAYIGLDTAPTAADHDLFLILDRERDVVVLGRTEDGVPQTVWIDRGGDGRVELEWSRGPSGAKVSKIEDELGLLAGLDDDESAVVRRISAWLRDP